MKKIFTLFVLLAIALLTSCTVSSPTCLTSEHRRFQANYNNPHTTPSCIGKECWRYQNR